MSNATNDLINEDRFYARQEWLEQRGNPNVLNDEKGDYIEVESDFTDSTGGQFDIRKVYLPEEICEI